MGQPENLSFPGPDQIGLKPGSGNDFDNNSGSENMISGWFRSGSFFQVIRHFFPRILGINLEFEGNMPFIRNSG